MIHMENCLLGSYCVCIFFYKSIKFSVINVDNCCVNQDIDVCAVHHDSTVRKFFKTIYQSPSGNFNKFITQLDMILQTLYSPKVDLIICGDININ